MPIVKTSKTEILKNAIILFKTKSYHKTSMSDIADSCGLLKGSLYHHFKNKREVALATLRYLHKQVQAEVYSIAYQKNLSNQDKMALFVQKVDDFFLHSEGGCLFGNLSLEISFQEVAFKEIIQENFDAWIAALAHILKATYGEKTALELAKEYVALTEGAVMMFNLYRDEKEYLKVGKKLNALLKTDKGNSSEK